MIHFSIIVPFRNLPEALLRRSLSSIPRRADIEVILVDDASEKVCSVDIFRALMPDVPLILCTLPEWRGPGAARNEGLGRAQGEWLLFLDGDDAFETAPLSELMQWCLSTSADVVYFDYLKVDSEEHACRVSSVPATACLPQEHGGLRVADLRPLYADGHQAWKKAVRRSLVERYSLRFEEIAYCEDQSFSVSLLEHAAWVAYWPEPLYRYVYRTDSVTHCLSFATLCDAMESTLRLNRRLVRDSAKCPLIVSGYILHLLRRYSYLSFLKYVCLDLMQTGWNCGWRDYLAACAFSAVSPNPAVDLIDRLRVSLGAWFRQIKITS